MNYNTPEEAVKAWDKEHEVADGSVDNGNENVKVETCPGCGEPMDENHAAHMFDDVENQTMHIHVEKVEDGRLGTIVDLPDNKPTAYLFLLSAIETMSLAGGDSFEDIIEEVTRMKNLGALSSPQSLKK